jgi:hypothetical protein
MMFKQGDIVKTKCPKGKIGSVCRVGIIKNLNDCLNEYPNQHIHRVVFGNGDVGVFWDDDENLFLDDTNYDQYLGKCLYSMPDEFGGMSYLGIPMAIELHHETGIFSYRFDSGDVLECFRCRLLDTYFE